MLFLKLPDSQVVIPLQHKAPDIQPEQEKRYGNGLRAGNIFVSRSCPEESQQHKAENMELRIPAQLGKKCLHIRHGQTFEMVVGISAAPAAMAEPGISQNQFAELRDTQPPVKLKFSGKIIVLQCFYALLPEEMGAPGTVENAGKKGGEMCIYCKFYHRSREKTRHFQPFPG